MRDTFKAKGDPIKAAFIQGWRAGATYADPVLWDGWSLKMLAVTKWNALPENNKNVRIEANSRSTAKQESVRKDTAPSSK